MADRPNPEKLLELVQEEERQAHKGKLKIYLGAAPGVGKTYSMLHDAATKSAQGIDVVIGVVESHGRSEIDEMIKQFEVIPRVSVEYRNKILLDFDIDAALKRNPSLILMDEMAHNNAPGLRHNKRWQDIKELLDRGIDVYTTLNVQHVESLNDIVSQILHTQIKETIPDSMLELAQTIELVDLPPEDLIKRLQEGKVYFPDQIELAKDSYFREGNLIALRELALRTTAQRVSAQVLLYRHGKGIKHIWPTNEKLLVCVGPNPESVKLIRTARRIATDMDAEWIAVYVDIPRLQGTEHTRNTAIQYLRLAEQLGGQTQILTGFDLINEIMSFAREQNVTQIIIGKRVRPRWREFLFKGLADEVIRASNEIDVYVVTGDPDDYRMTKPKSTKPKKQPWLAYGVSVSLVLLATMVNFLLFPYFNSANFIFVYLLCITLVALFGELGPAILSSVLSALCYDFFFTQPYFSLAIHDIQDVISIFIMLIVAQIFCHLTILNRRQAISARMIQQQTSSLHILSRQLAATRGVDKLLEVALQYIAHNFSSDVMVLLPDNNGELKVRARYKTNIDLDTKEMGVAQWVNELGQIAGLGTNTLPFSDSIYLPLLTSQGTLGVLRIHPVNVTELYTPQQIHVLEACANQIATAIEADRLEEEAKENELQKETDKIRSMLLQSISHDLRAPLVAVMGSATTLLEMATKLDTNSIKKIGREIYVETEQVNRLINNLLQISYLEENAVKLQKNPRDMKEIINDVISTSNKKLGIRDIELQIPADIPLIPLDETLIQEVLLNLIDNIVKFTPPRSPIEIEVELSGSEIVVSVADRGPGIVLDEINNLFEKFYRGRMLTTERGLGLGLAICRLVILAHNGRIWAENRKDGGAVFKFTLPLKE